MGEIYANYNLMLLPSFNKWPVQEADKQIIYPVQNHALLGGTYPLRPNKEELSPPGGHNTVAYPSFVITSRLDWSSKLTYRG